MNEIEKISSISVSDWKIVKPKYYSPGVGMDTEIAAEILFEVNDILKSINIDYYLVCGTALGLYREGNFIEWDDEIDIEIYSEVFVPRLYELKKTFIEHGFIARETFRGDTSKMAVFKKGIKVAMGAIYDNGDGYRCDLAQKFPSKFYDNFETLNFKGIDFKMPGPISEYLTFYYGDWETPIKSYNPNEYLNKNNNWRK